MMEYYTFKYFKALAKVLKSCNKIQKIKNPGNNPMIRIARGH